MILLRDVIATLRYFNKKCNDIEGVLVLRGCVGIERVSHLKIFYVIGAVEDGDFQWW